MGVLNKLSLKKTQTRIAVLSFAVIIFIIVIKFLNIDYQDNDDYIYTMIMSGTYSGTPSAMTVYEGYLYGYCISSLYKLFPGITEWYAFITHLLYISSFLVITWKLFSSKASDLLKYLTFLGALAVQVYLILSPQFTILAGELALAASVCLLGAPKFRHYTIAGILIFISSQIRFNALLMVFLLMCPLLFFPIKFKSKLYWIKPIVVFSIICGSLAINTISNNVYYQNDKWSYYSEYNKPRGVIEQNSRKLQALEILTDSIKSIEYKTLCNAGYIDGKILSIDEMNKCAKYLQSKSGSLFRMNIKPYFQGLNNHCLIIIAVWYIILIIQAIYKKHWQSLSIIACTSILFISELYYAMSTSWVKERIIICLMMPLFTVACICSYRLIEKKMLKYMSVILAILFTGKYVMKSFHWENEVNTRLQSTEIVNQLLSQLPDKKLVMIGIPVYAEAYLVSKTPCTSKYIAKGWLNNSPLHSCYYNGYKSLVNGTLIMLNKNSEENLINIQNVISLHYHISTSKNTILETEDYEIVQLVAK
jgi:hypothetical protein